MRDDYFAYAIAGWIVIAVASVIVVRGTTVAHWVVGLLMIGAGVVLMWLGWRERGTRGRVTSTRGRQMW